jgi:hypothetical protein
VRAHDETPTKRGRSILATITRQGGEIATRAATKRHEKAVMASHLKCGQTQESEMSIRIRPRVLLSVAAVALAAALGGCYYPAGYYGYGYGYGSPYGYGYPGYAYAGPTVAFGVGGWGGGWYDHGWYGHDHWDH